MEMELLQPSIAKNDRTARWLIFTFSIVVFAAVVLLSRVKLEVDLGFDKHLFAKANAIINSMVSLLLICGLVAVKSRKYLLHKRIMLSAIVLSCLFLSSYICHHLFTGETKFGGTGSMRYFYFFVLGTHILLAAIILPFVLFTAYRGLTGEYDKHRKLTRITWPVWLYVSVTGVLVYLMISPYYTS
jgi:putative membrane protein